MEIENEALAESESFRIETSDSETACVLRLSGCIGAQAVSILCAEAKQLASRGKNIAIDWSVADNLSGSAFQVLLALGLMLEKGGHKLYVAVDNERVRESAEMVGIAASFPTVEQRG